MFHFKQQLNIKTVYEIGTDSVLNHHWYKWVRDGRELAIVTFKDFLLAKPPNLTQKRIYFSLAGLKFIIHVRKVFMPSKC